jgi:CheY-like chemotaxis protein
MTQKLRIMVVDDDETTLEVTAALLESRGHEVIQRNSALGTTLAILRDKPAVVLLDVHMPGLSGDRLVELVAPRKDRPRPIIILHSASTLSELEQLAQRCGAAGVIEKTGDGLEFIKRFEQVLSTNRRAAEPARQRGR